MIQIEADMKPAFYAAEMDTQVPKIYFNGFTVSCRPGDVLIYLNRNEDKPAGMLYMSHTIAKSLGEALVGILKDFEAQTEQIIKTTTDYDRLAQQRQQR